MEKQQNRRLLLLAAMVTTTFGAVAAVEAHLATDAFAQSRRRPGSVVNPQQVPTARYGRGEVVDLSLIIEEWRSRYPATPVFACACMAAECDRTSQWPFRDYARYQTLVALGNFNAASNESAGFNCFDIETGDRPEGA